MNGKTHLAAGVLVGIGVDTLCGKIGIQQTEIPLIAGSALGSLLPDIDISGSMLGRFVPLWLFVEHRTVTHSLFFILVVGLIGLLLKASCSLNIGLMIGVASHLMLDGITYTGLPYLFYPFYRK